jgi:hypothetical protein
MILASLTAMTVLAAGAYAIGARSQQPVPRVHIYVVSDYDDAQRGTQLEALAKYL